MERIKSSIFMDKESLKKTQLSLQDYSSIGYVFLLIVGIFYETIYYRFLGINILEYSSVLDVLISPISLIAGRLTLMLGIVFSFVLSIAYIKIMPIYFNWLGKTKKYQTEKHQEKLKKIKTSFNSKYLFIGMAGFYILLTFLGFGVASGEKTKKKIEQEKIELTHQLVFKDGEHQNVHMLGKNSLYVFYVTQEKREVSITPIGENIKVIRKLKED